LINQIIDIIKINAIKFSDRWVVTKSNERRLLTLLSEIGELADSIKGKHNHPVEVELIQIAGICTNWLVALKAEKDFDLQIAMNIANHEEI